jgi:integrase
MRSGGLKVARDYLTLLLFTGLRRREATGLRWEDVDLHNRVITVPAAGNKSRRKLDLPMTDVVRDMLVARRALGDARFIFPGNSRSGHIEEPKAHLDRIAATTGIHVSAHDLRRTYITVASRTEITGRDLKALVNHSLGTDVTAGYDQVIVADLREPAQKVCDRLKKLCGIEPISGENVTALSV